MKKYILLFLLLAPCAMLQMKAQNYIVTSLATPGAATFTSDEIKDGVINLPFKAGTYKIPVETNQVVSSVTVQDGWLEASFANDTLTLNVEENIAADSRSAVLALKSKDFHPLFITVKQEARLAFAVISDTHIGNRVGEGPMKKVPQALQNLTRYGKLDALAVVGDLTDHGDTDQYEDFDSIFNHPDIILNPVDKFLFMMGNHDNYNGSGQQNYRLGLKNFNLRNGKPSNYPLHQYVLIKGYPFITISVLGGANNDDNENDGRTSYPSTVLKTLENYLVQATQDAPGKPIFVFAHVGPRNTCYSSWGNLEGAAWAMWRLNTVLKNYPQAVVFCGHSHYPLGDPRSIHQGSNPDSENMNYYTVINTASTTYSEINPGAVDAGIHPEGYDYVTEGMILYEQANGDIEIRRYDTYRDVEIDPNHRWVLKYPFDGSKFEYADIRDANDNPNNVPLRDGLPAPQFFATNNPPITVDVYPNDATVRFIQATDNECVFRYKVRLLKDGNEVKSAFVFSQFYLTTDMPSELSYTFDGLDENTQYNVEVVAYDSYDNQSEPLITTFTTTTDNAPVPEPVGWWTFDDPNDLLAGTGVATMQGASHSAGVVNVSDELDVLGIVPAAGPSEDNGAISVPVNSSLLMTTNLNTPNLDTYSFLMDIHVADINKGYTALYQNDLTNSKDGSLFINSRGQIGKNVADLGYNGLLLPTQWYRVVFVVRNNKAKVYVDGKLVGQSSAANATNWLMSTGALFFGDDNTEEHIVDAAEMRFWDKALTKNQVAELGPVPTIGGPIEVTIPDALGTWTFDNPNDLYAGTGTATMTEGIHNTDGSGGIRLSPDGYVVTAVEGPTEGNGALSVPVGICMYMRTNLNVTEMTTYSVMWDVKAEDISSFIPLLQNDIENKKDGSLFLNKNMVGLNAAGLGYHGTVLNNKWYRILFVVEDGFGKVYVDGALVGASTEACLQHWKLNGGALFFADDDGEEKEIQTAEIRFWNVALDAAQAAKLGAINLDTPDPGTTFPKAKGIWTFDNPANLMDGTGVSTLQPSKHSKGNVTVSTLEDAGIVTAAGPSEANGAIFIPNGSSLKMTTNLEATSISSFSFMMDIKLANFNNYMPIFQNDLTNSRDACLFVNKTSGALGIRFGGLGYSDATLTPGKWHRVVVVSKDAKMTVYLDGAKVVGESPEAVPDRWQLGTATLFFADEDGEEMDIETAELRFWDVALTADQAAELGEAGSDFVEPQPIDPDAAFCSWTFNDIDDPLLTTGGTGTGTLQPYKKGSDGTMSVTGSLADAGITPADGLADGDRALYVPVNSSLLMTPANCNNLSTFSFLMDVKFDDVSGFASIFQNEITNKRDASLFIHDGEIGYATSGLGYNGTINAGQWYRLVAVVKDNRITVYLDGQKVIQSINANANIWSMKDALAFFADQDEEEQPATISELRFWDKELTAKQVFKLGRAGGGEAQEVVLPDATGAWDFDNPSKRFTGTGTASLNGWKKVDNGTVVNAIAGPHSEIAAVSGPTESNGAVVVPVDYGLEMTTNLETQTLDSYTLLMDICLDDVSGYAALYQNDDSNKKDGSLFVHDGQVGVNSAGLGYNGTINPGQWHRIVFMVNNLIGYVFIDGVKVGRSGSGGETHWKMGQKALFFVDDDGEEKDIKTCEIRFWDKVLTEGEVEKLGAVPME